MITSYIYTYVFIYIYLYIYTLYHINYIMSNHIILYYIHKIILFHEQKKPGKLPLAARSKNCRCSFALSKDCPLHMEKHVKTSESRLHPSNDAMVATRLIVRGLLLSIDFLTPKRSEDRPPVFLEFSSNYQLACISP